MDLYQPNPTTTSTLRTMTYRARKRESMGDEAYREWERERKRTHRRNVKLDPVKYEAHKKRDRECKTKTWNTDTMDTEEESRVYKSVHQSNKILQYLYENRHKPHNMCDMMLVAVDQTFPVHRAAVAAASPYIRCLLIDSVTEGIYSSVLILSEYISITSFTLEILVSYIYQGSIELCSDNFESLMEAAGALQMDELKEFCQEYQDLLSSLKKTTQLEEEKSSKSGAAWNVHMRPFSCKYCLQNFPKLDAYKRHCRCHEKIYRKHWLKKLRSESSRANRRPGRYSLRDRRKLQVTGFQYPEDEYDDDSFNYDVKDQDDEDTDFIIDETLEMDEDLEIDETFELTNEVRRTGGKKFRCSNGHGKSVGQGPIPKDHAESVGQTQDSGHQLLLEDCEELLYSGFRGYYQCNLCQEKFNLKPDILRHIMDHKPWKCTICNTHFRTQEQLHIHQRVHKESQYKCPACPWKFSRARYVDAHLRGHSNPSAITCCHCNERFRSKAKLDEHLLNEHSQYQCSICQKACSCQSQLATHLLIHRKERPYICNKCGKSFKQKHNFLNHEREVHERKIYKCEYCHRTLKGRGCLRIHLRQHTGEKPFKCNRCDERFLYKYKLQKHEKTHESGGVEVIKKNKITKKKAPPKIKPKTTPQRKSDRLILSKSSEVVAPPRPQPQHKCDHCEASFMFESGLIAHLRTDHMIQTMPNLKSLLGVNLFLDDW